jgi:hypothetical protein
VGGARFDSQSNLLVLPCKAATSNPESREQRRRINNHLALVDVRCRAQYRRLPHTPRATVCEKFCNQIASSEVSRTATHQPAGIRSDMRPGGAGSDHSNQPEQK